MEHWPHSLKLPVKELVLEKHIQRELRIKNADRPIFDAVSVILLADHKLIKKIYSHPICHED
jgi:hypothetical protein